MDTWACVKRCVNTMGWAASDRDFATALEAQAASLTNPSSRT